jgi:hypothetical protein
MLLVLALVSLMQVEKKADLEKTKLFVYDSEKGMTFRVRDDGKVELTLREEKGEKTYQADSAEDFSRKYPEVVKKNGLRKFLRPADGGVAQNDFEQLWSELRKNRRLLPELPEFGNPLDEDWQRLLQDPRKLLEEFRRRVVEPPNGEDPAPAPAPEARPPAGGKEFGIKIDSVGETLRDQLSLKEGEGVLVGEVKPGSVAEKAGIKQHDIILTLDGKAVGDKWEFRKDVLRALERPEFDVEILRGGKREGLKAKTAGKKDE